MRVLAFILLAFLVIYGYDRGAIPYGGSYKGAEYPLQTGSTTQYTLTVNNDGNGTTNPNGSSDVDSAINTNISASALAGYAFLNWSVTSGSGYTFGDSTLANTTIKLESGDVTISANFQEIVYDTGCVFSFSNTDTTETWSDAFSVATDFVINLAGNSDTALIIFSYTDDTTDAITYDTNKVTESGTIFDTTSEITPSSKYYWEFFDTCGTRTGYNIAWTKDSSVLIAEWLYNNSEERTDSNYYWQGDVSSSWSVGDNWYGAVAPQSDDTAYFCADSSFGPCELDQDVHVAKLTFDVDWDQNFTDGGYACTSDTRISLNAADETDTFNLTGSMISTLGITLGSTPTIIMSGHTTIIKGADTGGEEAAITISSNNQIFDTLIIDGEYEGVLEVQPQDSLTVTGKLVLTSGPFNQNGYGMYVLGDIDINCESIFDSYLVCGGDIIVTISSLTTTGSEWHIVKNGAVITTNGETFPTIILDSSATINDGCTINRFLPSDGMVYTFESGQTYTYSTIESGDLNGSTGKRIEYKSSVPGSAAIWLCPTCDTIDVSYTKFTDITVGD